MRIFLLICRILVGATFIISGLIKANDPVGFSIKLQEYFEASALGLPWLMPFSLMLAMLACLAEVVLGFAVLVGGRMKLATWSLLIFTIFFGWLTAYTATCDPQAKYAAIVDGQTVMKDVTCVTDCGCFGDAVKGSLGRPMTPWESFSKDAILFVFVLPLFIFRKRIGFNTWGDDLAILPISMVVLAFYCWVFAWWFPLLLAIGVLIGYLLIKRFMEGPRAEWTTAIWVAAVALFFMWNCYEHLPMRDYRPYAIGLNIAEEKAKEIPPVQDVYLSYKNSKTGEVKEFDSKGTYPWDDSTWVYVDRRVEVHNAGYDSPVRDFVLTDGDGNDITADLLNETEPVLFVVANNIGQTRTGSQSSINKLVSAAQKKGWYVYGLTSSGYNDVEDFRHAHDNMYDYLTCDDVTLKTMIRSNPGIVLMQRGTVRGKWSSADVPSLGHAEHALK